MGVAVWVCDSCIDDDLDDARPGASKANGHFHLGRRQVEMGCNEFLAVVAMVRNHCPAFGVGASESCHHVLAIADIGSYVADRSASPRWLHKHLTKLDDTTDLSTTLRIEAAWFCASYDNATYVNGLRKLISCMARGGCRKYLDPKSWDFPVGASFSWPPAANSGIDF
eukprot:9759450-Karenia_brevis.AAC.1